MKYRYYSVFKINEILINTTWMNLDNMLGKQSQKAHMVQFYLYRMCKIGKFIESKLVIIRSSEKPKMKNYH